MLSINHPSHQATDQTTIAIHLAGGTLIRTYVAPRDGDRYYDLSAHTQEEAEQLAPALIDFGKLPCRLPDKR